MKKLKRTLMATMFATTSIFITACDSNKGPAASEDEFGISMQEVIANAKKLKYDEGGSQSTEKTGTCNFEVPAEGYDGSDITLTFYHTMGSNLSDVLDIYIEEFNQIYPNIHIEWQQVGSYDDVRNQISTEITVGNQPNIAYCYPDHVALYNLAGAVATLDNLIDSQVSDGNGGIIGLTEEQKADFIEGYYKEGTQFGDGLMYTMPFSKSTEVLYYNKTFFDKNKIPVPDHWFTESEDDTTSMEAVCEKIREIDPMSIPLGYDSEANWFITMCEQCGSDYTSASGEHYLFDNSTNKLLLKRFQTWYQKNYVTTQKLYGSYTSGLFTSTDSIKSYMSIGSSAGATHQRPKKVDDAYPFEVGIVSIPQMSGSYQRVISQGPSVCIFNKTNKQEVVASWLFVKFLTTSVEFQAEFSIASGYVPVLKSVGENEYYKKQLAKADGYDYIAMLSAKVCLEQEKAYYTSPAFNGSSTARDQVNALLAKVISSTDLSKKFIDDAFVSAINECKYQG